MDFRAFLKENKYTIKSFSEKYSIPYRTVQNWASGARRAPEWVYALLEKTEAKPKALPRDFMNLMRVYTEGLRRIYKKELKRVVLYGSYARGDYHENSDIDILILLDCGEEQIRAHRKELSAFNYEFNMEHDTEVIPMVIDQSHYHEWEDVHPFYRNVKTEGAILYE